MQLDGVFHCKAPTEIVDCDGVTYGRAEILKVETYQWSFGHLILGDEQINSVVIYVNE